MLQDIRQYVVHRDSISISSIDTGAYQIFVARLGIKIVAAKGLQENQTRTSLAKPFVWDARNESAHSEEYMAWLQKNIRLPRGFLFVDGRKQADLLSVQNPAFPFSVTGTADALVVDRDYVRNNFVSRGILIVFSFKKAVDSSHATHQAVIQHVLADIHSNYTILTILTDLGHHWQCFWFIDNRTIMSTVLSLEEAFHWIRDVVAQHAQASDKSEVEELKEVPRCRHRTKFEPERSLMAAHDQDTQLEELDEMLSPEDQRETRLLRALDLLYWTPGFRDELQSRGQSSHSLQ